MAAIASTIISSLDTPRSLIPFFVKDAFDVTGRTIMADKEGGKHEAREKFIEEAGSSLFWIGGIPAFRAISNKIVKNKIDTDIHYKRICSDGVQGYFTDEMVQNVKEGAKEVQNKKFSKADLEGIVFGGEKLGAVKEKLTKSGMAKYKNYHVGMTTASILFNLGMLTIAVPMFNQFLSRKIISKEYKKNAEQNSKKYKLVSFQSEQNTSMDKYIGKTNSKNLKDDINVSNKPSFGSLATLKDLVNVKKMFNFEEMAKDAQLNVTSSMLLLDYGISGSRVTFIPRDNNERIEYAVKEGGIILFFYYAADLIGAGLSKIANKVFHTPIDLDYRIISDKNFAEKMKTKKEQEVLKFASKPDELNIIKFIDKELAKAPKDSTLAKDKVFSNFTLQMAQKSGLVDVEYDSKLNQWIRHSKKYIETDKVAALNDNLKNFYEKGIKNTPVENIEKIFSKTKTAKVFSVFGNMAICCASLSFFLPKIQYMIREHRTKTKAAPGIKLYQEKAEKNLI